MSGRLTRQQQFEQALRTSYGEQAHVSLGGRVIRGADEARDRYRQRLRVEANLRDLRSGDERGVRSFWLELFFLLLLIGAIYVVFQFALSMLMGG